MAGKHVLYPRRTALCDARLIRYIDLPEAGRAMVDVFLSYKREDAGRVRRLVAALRQLGLDVWWDEDIPAGAPWETTIEKALAEAKTVIVCWSPASVASENVRSEARVARADGRLIQVFLRACEPPLFFGERQGFDLSTWRGKADDPRIRELADCVRRVPSGERVRHAKPREQRRSYLRIAAALTAFLVLIGAVGGWWLLSPAKADGPTTIAVLPFRTSNAADANLVDAIWDDTRGAISRNPNLRVIGRRAVEALAKKDLQPKDYRRKIGADYLLDGVVRRIGDQVQMNVSLVRTKDGAEIWADRMGGKLNDVFAFQTRIANEVEGRIRGRVAPGGGVTSKNIATSGEVYAIFADARAKARHRNDDDTREAIALLKKAIAIDPNYAPAWAELGAATGRRVGVMSPTRGQEEQAVAYLKRALELAPNLAHAHAALAMVQNFPPETEPHLRRAVALDPSDAEAWTWLGNYLDGNNRLSEALAARDRAAQIEPLWFLTVANKIMMLAALGHFKEVDEEVDRIAHAGDRVLLMKIKALAAATKGRIAEQVLTLIQLRAAHPEESSFVDAQIYSPLIQLGFIDQAARAQNQTSDILQLYNGVPLAPGYVDRSYDNPVDFWLSDDVPMLFGRVLPKHDRLAEYVGYYRAAFRTPEDVGAAFAHRAQNLVMLAPNLAVNLRAAGEAHEADALLQQAEAILVPLLRNGPKTPDLSMNLAHLRAAEGRDDEAVALLKRAVAGGWLPDAGFYAVDMADEPCFARLLKRPDFLALRKRVLAHIAEERRKIPLELLARAYPSRRELAA